ncbi:hypothetical protein C8Q80DRAFT_1217783 [Daedaleopsis nitida]|nr:hypothetical protein C8Q80DRAFT_1217783 [Daedaleopsis nitida]
MASSPSKGRASGALLSPPVPGTPPPRSKSPTMPPSPTTPSPRRPPASRAQTHTSTMSLGVPSTPYYTPHVSSVNVANVPKRLLMPTVRSVKPPAPSPRLPPAAKSSSSRLGRSVAGSLSTSAYPDANERTVVGASDWLVGGEKFEVIEEQLELEGFQIYAVEKWVVAQKRPVLVLTVYTGDPKHKITVTALSPQASLPPADAQKTWDEAMRNLRREGARPKETEKGTLMVTSLANFRSDYTIVHVPSGNFLDAREQLYSNINLLRMGCGGRAALTLEEPSDATKDRFISMYHVTDKAHSRTREQFIATVLELVKLIQAALAIFGMFDMSLDERNGLLCDATCEGIQRWVTEIGEPYHHIEPTEKVADPTVIAALFSVIVSVRSKLHALGIVVPKDPFMEPAGFVRALATFHTSKSHHPHGHPPHINILPTSPTSHTGSSTSTATSPVPPVLSPCPSASVLTQALIDSIQSQYAKLRQSDSYKVHRVLKNKLDDLAMDLRTHVAESGGGSSVTSHSVTSDLAAFARCVVSSKDAPQSLRYFWTGRPGYAEKKRREKEAVWSDGEREREREDGERDDREGAAKDGRERDDRGKERDKQARSGDESEPMWAGRVKEKMLAGFKGKKLSVDFGTLGKAFLPESPRGPAEKSGQSSMVPSVVVSREPADEEELLSSGQQSPISDAPNPLMLGVGSLPHAERSASELSEYDRRVSEFNQKRPYYPKTQSRIISWSDARSARGMLHENGSKENQHRGRLSPLPTEDDGASIMDPFDLEKQHRRRLLVSGSERRRSLDDAPEFANSPILPVERMRIDVALCGQLLVMRRREAHLANVVACLQAVAYNLAAQNARLRGEHERARDPLAALDARAGELQRLEALRTDVEGLTQETNALAYEGAQFRVEDLWHMAAQPRQRVFALREKVFGTGRRLPQGVRGAHGMFSRVQWTLDGTERLVDRVGRTESEAEEEEELPPLPGMEIDVAEEVDAVEHQNLKPTWLLRFFNHWGGRLGLSRTQEPAAPPGAPATKEHATNGDAAAANGSTSSSVALPVDDARSQLLQRTFTT